jgi:TonB family protein
MPSRFLLGLLFCLCSPCFCLSQTSGQAPIPDRFKGIILYAPLIEAPSTYFNSGAGVLRSRGTHSQSVGESMSAQGVYRITINQKTGTVDEVGVLLRTGAKQFDAAAVMTFFQWKFKPGAIKQLDVPVIFGRSIEINLRKAGSK